jgi:uncharacterized membrane protein
MIQVNKTTITVKKGISKEVSYLIATTILISILQSCTYENVTPAKAPIPSTVVSYSLTIAPINSAKCNNCHVPQGIGNGDFSNYAGVKVKVDNGSMYARIVTLKDMPTPGSGYVLSDEERNNYTAWINQGAKNN